MIKETLSLFFLSQWGDRIMREIERLQVADPMSPASTSYGNITVLSNYLPYKP